MTTAALATPRREYRGARVVVASVTTRRAVRSGIGWGVVFGFYVATQALTYATAYPSHAAREILVREFGSNTGVAALVGPAIRIDTVPGFTAWKCLIVLAITGAVWGVLISTRLTRGEEDAGRWEMLLAGATTRRAAARQALVALYAGFAAFYAVTAVIVVALGRSSKVGVSAGGALYFTLAVLGGAAMFLGVGALGAQLASTRRQAAGYASALLGASYALRMAADSDPSLGWMRWLSPLGWVEQMRPLTSPDPWALVPIAALSVACAVAAVALAGRRDLGASVLADHSSSRTRTTLLSGPFAVACRLARPTLVAWAVAIVAYGVLLGSIAKSGGQIFNSSPSMHLVFVRLGVTGAEAYLGFAMLIMALALGFVATGQVAAARAEESSGRLENLLVRPVSRARWLLGRVALASLAVVGVGLLGGMATYAGAESAHASVRFASLLAASINIAVPSLVVLGIGVLVLGLRPRATVVAVYAVMVWSFLVEITGGITNISHWILDTSVFHQMSTAPSSPVNWTVNAVMVGVAVACVAVGLAGFTRRDVIGD